MSVKNVQKQQKSKKASDVHSLRHQDKSAQSVSSLSSHIGDLKAQRKKLRQQLEDSQSSIDYYRKRMNQFMGLNDQISKEMAKSAKGELQLWQTTLVQTMTKLQIVEDRLREVYASPEKPKKKKNYALQKVEEPPSDNE